MMKFKRLPSTSNSALASLRRRWLFLALACLTLAGLGYVAVRQGWQAGFTPAQAGQFAGRWLLQAGAGLGYVLWVLQRGLPANRRAGESELLPSLGAGNLLTLLRGVLVSGLIGFLFLPRPQGWLAWLPGMLYLLADVADYLDGYLARITRHATRLGEMLDLSFDGLGVLAGAWLVVQYGQVPVWYLSVALARYLFLAAGWMRRRKGKPVYELPPSASRRALAGLQMVFIAVALLPVFSPPGTTIAALLFSLPFLLGFLKDWMVASGALFAYPAHSQRRSVILHWVPVAIRALIVVLSVGPLSQRLLHDPALAGYFAQPDASALVLTILEVAVFLLLLLGAGARASAILGLCLLGVSQTYPSLSLSQVLLVLAYSAILLLGSGALSLWTPETRLIYYRAGDPQPIQAAES